MAFNCSLSNIAQMKLCSKILLFLPLVAILSAEQNRFSNFGRGPIGRSFCSIFGSGSHLVQQSKIVQAKLVELQSCNILLSSIYPFRSHTEVVFFYF